MINIHMESLKKVIRSFYNICKMKIVLYDSKRTFLYSYPDSMSNFCAEVRKCEKLAQKCFACDTKGFDICDRTKKKHIYTCHMGLTEAIAPILENGITIGYMMLGQVLEISNRESVIKRLDSLSTHENIDVNVLKKEITKVQVITKETINSAADIMEMCACYLWLKQIIKVNEYSTIQHLSSFITSNLSGDLSIKTICHYLNISKSTLYKLSTTSFGMGISDYIRLRRIEAAKNLIKDNTLTISDVAVRCGIEDANYFTKFFKKYVNMTPSAYRKLIHSDF
ncbi:MAG: PocR ligand-binding domain-containing protein [Eubacteriales bacterium]|nr:PocR ligand-binding domain-containing protein [Eubacteriales bacterium]